MMKFKKLVTDVVPGNMKKSPKYALKVFEVKKKLDAKFCF